MTATTIAQRVTGNLAASISNRIPCWLFLSGYMQARSDALLLSGSVSDGDVVERLLGNAVHAGIGGTITQGN